MLETHLPVAGVHWTTKTFEVIHGSHSDPAAITGQICPGRFATARRVGNAVVLARDPLGLNKLYFTIDRERGVVAANYLADLIQAGIPFNTIYAVPAGTSVTIDPHARTIRLDRYHRLPATPAATDPGRCLEHARHRLSRHIAAAAASYPRDTVAVCLSGGLDSALIAALVRANFASVVAYTYAFDDHTGKLSPDAVGARHLARRLDIPFRLVTADAGNVLSALPRAYRFGQDWRDFNIHCAVVNDILATAIAADLSTTGTPVLVFTGDLMNELTGDYTTVRYRGQDFYALPSIPPHHARVSLVRGLQCGDREVGIFARHGLVTIQPYSQISDQLLQLPAVLPKQRIIRALAGTLLPDESYERPKARAQIGAPHATTGILPLMADSGRTGTRLEHEFRDALGITGHPSLRGRIRAGIYQFPSQYPAETS
jgi:asparagine synthetase B (glutamine-hydrolysing)